MGIMLDWKSVVIFALPVWIAIRALLIYRSHRRKKPNIKREVFINILYIYIIGFIIVTLFPLIIMYNGDRGMTSINIVPIISTINDIGEIIKQPQIHKSLIKNILGNIILFLPMSILLAMLWKKYENIKKLLTTSLLISITIEIAQLLSYYIGNKGRVFDIDDVLLNLLGAFIGYIFYIIIIKKVIKPHFFNDIREV